jgi:aspartate kinase
MGLLLQRVGIRREERNGVGVVLVEMDEVGDLFEESAGIAGKMFQTLSRDGINIQMISTSEIKVSCIIDSKYTELAVRVLHEAFGLDKRDIKAE